MNAYKISYQVQTNVAVRLSFQMPEFSKTGKLSGFSLQHVVINDAIAYVDFVTVAKCDTNWLADSFKSEAKNRLAKKFGLTQAQAEAVSYRGVSTVRHPVTERIPAHDARWV